MVVLGGSALPHEQGTPVGPDGVEIRMPAALQSRGSALKAGTLTHPDPDPDPYPILILTLSARLDPAI